jgi:nicotinamide riboside kinase
MKIALVGAGSTGKTTLAHSLADRLRERGHRVETVGEVLGEWCVREGRAPRPEEQLPIAQEQERRVDDATARAGIVIADTTALMVAIHGAMLFEDDPLYRFALERQRDYDLTLLTGLDIDGPHAREPVDALVREGLAKAGVAYRVVYGSGEDRVRNALAPVLELLGERPAGGDDETRWKWVCEKCSDPECEHRLFTGLAGLR